MAITDLVPVINGVSYTHADVVVNFGAVPIIGVISIDYSDSQEVNGNFSTGHEATSVGFGQVTNSCTLTISKEAMEILQLVAPNGKIQNYPFFDLGINYLPENQVPTRDVLRKCRFKGRQQSSSTGDSEIPVTLELFIGKIEYQRI